MAEKRFAEVDENEKERIVSSEKKLVLLFEVHYLVARELSWDSLFPQFETKQTTGRERRFAEVDDNEKERIVSSAIPKNIQYATQFGLTVFNSNKQD